MTMVFECNNPIQLRPFWHNERAMKRIGWLWFAVAYSPHRLDQLITGTVWVQK